MMFWKVNNLAQQPIAFYRFLSPVFTEGNTNPIYNHKLSPDGQTFDIVIDGQQRITSLLIGFSGSYQKATSKQPSYLYLRLDEANTNKELKYDFQFLTNPQLTVNTNHGQVWVKVSDVIQPSYNVVGELQRMGVVDNKYAQSTLNQLAQLVSNNNVLNYYEITSANIDEVLDIFVRTNSGGCPLKKGDLLMSALTVNWSNAEYDLNAREYVEGLIDDVEKLGYKINRDWVFKMFLMLAEADLSLKVSAFMANGEDTDTPQWIYQNSEEIAECVHRAFALVNAYHLVEKGLTTKLAIIPIVYYLFKNKLNKASILPTNAMSQVFDDMRHFIYRAIVKNLFEAGTDETLQTLRTLISQFSNGRHFPEKEIEKTLTKLKVTPADVQKLLNTKKADAFPILNIIYALGYDHQLCSMCPTATLSYDVDHIHPKSAFATDTLTTNDGHAFDILPNLELLDAPTNRSKNKQELSDWLENVSPTERQKLPKDHFFEGLPIAIERFDTFVQKREALLSKALFLL